MAVCIEVALNLVQQWSSSSGDKYIRSPGQLRLLAAAGCPPRRHARSGLRDGGEIPGRMDIVHVVGKSFAERYPGLDQDSRRIWIVGLQRHDANVGRQPERRRRGQGRDFVINRIGRRRRIRNIRSRRSAEAAKSRGPDREVPGRLHRRRGRYRPDRGLGSRARRTRCSALARLRCRRDRCCGAGEQQ